MDADAARTILNVERLVVCDVAPKQASHAEPYRGGKGSVPGGEILRGGPKSLLEWCNNTHTPYSLLHGAVLQKKNNCIQFLKVSI